MKRLLIFLPSAPEAEPHWLVLDGDRVTRRGSWPVAQPLEADETLAIAPGAAVAVHWAEMPQLSPAQASAAARLLAADVCATPIDDVHVAVGRDEGQGWRAIGIVARAQAAEWLSRLARAGVDPDRLLPLPLLMLPSSSGVRTLVADGLVVARGARLAFAAEPDVARLLISGSNETPLDADAFEAQLGAAVDAAPLDLRQGGLASRRPWVLDSKRLRRLLLLAGAILAVWLIGDVARLLRYDFAADRLELAARDQARKLLPRGTVVIDPQTQVAAYLAERQGSQFGSITAALFAALRESEGVELVRLRYRAGEGLQATIAADPRAVAVIAERLRGAGLTAHIARTRAAGGRQEADLELWMS